MQKPLSILALLGLLVVAACNTAEGVGKDMQSAGEAIEDKAKE